MIKKLRAEGHPDGSMEEETWQVGKKIQDIKVPNEDEECMRILAELAGAVAHELFQPLTAININADLLLMGFLPEDPRRQYVDNVLYDVEKMTTIINKLGQISSYQTKPYLGGAKIVDLEKSHQENNPDRSR